MSWIVDPRMTRHYGNVTLDSERDGQATAHRITLSDERILRVLPDEAHSGLKRAHVVRLALESAEALGALSVDLVETYIAGALGRAGLTWEVVDLAAEELEELEIEDWLTDWFKFRREPVPDGAAKNLMKDLRSARLEIVRT